jgi:hypothetical protein
MIHGEPTPFGIIDVGKYVGFKIREGGRTERRHGGLIVKTGQSQQGRPLTHRHREVASPWVWLPDVKNG